MDWLLERQDKTQKKRAKKHLAVGDPVQFDLSSSYFEGQCCELAQFGYSRDHRGDRKQVNYGIEFVGIDFVEKIPKSPRAGSVEFSKSPCRERRIFHYVASGNAARGAEVA